MANNFHAIIDRFDSIINKKGFLSPKQLWQEAETVKECVPYASNSVIIQMLLKILRMWSGDLAPDCNIDRRFVAWMTGSSRDRGYFMATVRDIVSRLCAKYAAEEAPDNELSRQRLTEDFSGLSCVKHACHLARERHECALYSLIRKGMNELQILDMNLGPFLTNIDDYAFKIMENIVSLVSIKEMKLTQMSEMEHVYFLQAEFQFYRYLMKCSGEVTEYFIVPRPRGIPDWKFLFQKLDSCSNRDFLIFRATNMTCVCKKSLDSESESAILDNCYDLLCVKCARKIFRVRSQERKCPSCAKHVKNWISSTLFDKFKAPRKKRKCKFPQGPYAVESGTEVEILDSDDFIPNKRERADGF